MGVPGIGILVGPQNYFGGHKIESPEFKIGFSSKSTILLSLRINLGLIWDWRHLVSLG